MLMFWMMIFACGQKEQNSVDSSESEDTAVAVEEPSVEPTSDPSTGDDPGEEPSSDPASEPTSEPTLEPLELVGSYSDNIGSEHVITQDLWLIDYGSNEQYYYHIDQYSNDEDYLIAENDDANGSPESGAWSRFDWVYHADTLWVCQTMSTATSQQEALAAEPPDVDIAGSCTPYGWMQLY